MSKPAAKWFGSSAISLVGMFLLLSCLNGGCDRMITPRNTQIVKDADAKARQGDYLRAISLYEAALDDSPACAEIHYKMALLYDDKMNDPLNALHHFKRYLTLDPTGSHATDVKSFMKRDEITLATTLPGDVVVTRLKNENLNLRKELDERASKAHAADKPEAVAKRAEKNTVKAGNKIYTVESGDTLFSISQKFYHSSHRWKEIRDANKEKVGEGGKLKPGETLTIP